MDEEDDFEYLSFEETMEERNYQRRKEEYNKGKNYYIECDSRYDKNRKLYYQDKTKYEKARFSIFFDNRTLFDKKTAEKILSKLKFNNPRIVKDKEYYIL